MKKLLLLFFAICLIRTAIGQELKEPTEVDFRQEELARLEAEKTAIESKLLEISEAPLKHAQDKIKRLDEWLPKLPDRKPTKAGNITMKQYLSQLKAEIEKDPAGYVVKETEKLLSSKAQIEAQITTLAEEVGSETTITEK